MASNLGWWLDLLRHSLDLGQPPLFHLEQLKYSPSTPYYFRSKYYLDIFKYSNVRWLSHLPPLSEPTDAPRSLEIGHHGTPVTGDTITQMGSRSGTPILTPGTTRGEIRPATTTPEDGRHLRTTGSASESVQDSDNGTGTR